MSVFEVGKKYWGRKGGKFTCISKGKKFVTFVDEYGDKRKAAYSHLSSYMGQDCDYSWLKGNWSDEVYSAELLE